MAEKDQERYAVVIAWLRTRLSFEILRSVHVSVRGTRSPFHRKQCEVVDDFLIIELSIFINSFSCFG